MNRVYNVLDKLFRPHSSCRESNNKLGPIRHLLDQILASFTVLSDNSSLQTDGKARKEGMKVGSEEKGIVGT